MNRHDYMRRLKLNCRRTAVRRNATERSHNRDMNRRVRTAHASSVAVLAVTTGGKNREAFETGKHLRPVTAREDLAPKGSSKWEADYGTVVRRARELWRSHALLYTQPLVASALK